MDSVEMNNIKDKEKIIKNVNVMEVIIYTGLFIDLLENLDKQ